MSATQDALAASLRQHPELDTRAGDFWCITVHSRHDQQHEQRRCTSCGMVLIHPIRDNRFGLCMDCAADSHTVVTRRTA